jgi:6-phosphogluconolactonase
MQYITHPTKQLWQDAIIHNLLPYTTNTPITIALSGGSTPKTIYTAMKSLAIRASAHFYQVDERYVPKDHKDSNERMIQETLQPNHFYPIETTIPLEQSIAQYASIIPTSFDCVILGIGTDGHTASLFPHTEELTSTSLVAHTLSPQGIQDRITLTFASIMNAKHLLLIAQGKEKKQTIHELLHGTKPKEAFPAKYVLTHPSLHIHYTEEI